MKNIYNTTLDRDSLGFRYFSKDDGCLYETVPTGVYDSEGKMVYEDSLVSESGLDVRSALTLKEYKLVDDVVNDERDNPNRVTSWLRSLSKNVKKFDGMNFKTYWYDTITGATSSRSTMDLEDDAPGTTVSVSQDGVPLPLEFADWQSNIRRDPSASTAAGLDVSARKAGFAATAVANGLDLRQINGWGKLTYNGVTVYGFRDVPANVTVSQTGETGEGGWLDPDVATVKNIYADIVNMVKALNTKKIPGPYILMLPDSFRFRLAETYETSTNGVEKSLWMKLLERPSANIPNVLNIQDIKLIPELDETKGGGSPSEGEAYLLSLDPKCFRVLSYLPMQSFTIGLKGGISTKHRVAEGVCPLFKKNANGIYGICKLTKPKTA